MPSIGDIMGCSPANSTITKRASSLRLAKEKGSLLGNFKVTQLGTVFEKSDFIDEREKNYDHLGTAFRAWSLDSSRLLIGIYAEGSEHGPLFVYFNTRTKALEQTPYLRELNKAVAKQTDNYAHDIVCAEPTAPLPPESELKARLDALNEKLNRAFAARVERTKEQDDANDLRQVQDKWEKMRDEAAKTYLAFAPKGEEERRRLQFLGDVTATRIEELNQLSIAALTDLLRLD
jgi:uncharacterized protein YecT (DUF1311 family)